MARNMLIGFPAGGLEKKVSYRQNKPFTTVDCLNVRPSEVIEGRERGGSRPGLQGPSSRENFGSEIRLLVPMSFAPPRGGFMILENYFPGSVLEDVWGDLEPPYGIYFPPPTLSGDGLAGINWMEERTARTVHTYTLIDVTRRYTIWMYITPHEGIITPSIYNIIARLSTVEPNYYTDGLGIGLQLSIAVPGYFRFNWRSRVGGVTDDGGSSGSYAWTDNTKGDWFGVTFNGNTLVSATFGGVTETINMAHSNHSGTRVGFEMHSGPLGAAPYDPIWISAYNIEYFTTDAPLLRTLLATSAGGNLYEEWNARE